MLSLLICVLALILDQRPGKPGQFDPVPAFATLAANVRDWLHTGDHLHAGAQRLRGLLGVALLSLLPAILALLLASLPYLDSLVALVLLYFALDGRRLRETLLGVERQLQAGELDTARTRLATLTPQDTRDMDADALSRLAVETALEEALDRVFAVLFWYLVAGAAGLTAYWTISQLDRAWGHPTPRYRHFGWASARLDDLLNWLPAQLLSLSYLLVGRDWRAAFRCWREQRQQWKSPKGGALLATGGGSLGLQLGGATQYFGQMVVRSPLGHGLLCRPDDIRRARHLLYRALGLWLGLPLLILAPGLG